MPKTGCSGETRFVLAHHELESVINIIIIIIIIIIVTTIIILITMVGQVCCH